MGIENMYRKTTETRMMKNNHKSSNYITVIFLTIIMTVMEMTGLPTALFINIQIKDVNPIYFTLMCNFALAVLLCFCWKQYIKKDWFFGLQLQGIWQGLKKHSLPGIIATIVVLVSFYVGLAPFDYKPSVLKIIIEGFVYYIGVGIMEELYLRGLLQNLLEKWFNKKEYGILNAILISSALFGVGHIFGAIGQPVYTILCKAIWATALGVYWGGIYYCTRNLWIPIILHTCMDFAGVPFCFTSTSQYPTVALFACLLSYTVLGVYGVVIVVKELRSRNRYS